MYIYLISPMIKTIYTWPTPDKTVYENMIIVKSANFIYLYKSKSMFITTNYVMKQPVLSIASHTCSIKTSEWSIAMQYKAPYRMATRKWYMCMCIPVHHVRTILKQGWGDHEWEGGRYTGYWQIVLMWRTLVRSYLKISPCMSRLQPGQGSVTDIRMDKLIKFSLLGHMGNTIFLHNLLLIKHVKYSNTTINIYRVMMF